jgi:2-dehydro-3-deoxygluconokinase
VSSEAEPEVVTLGEGLIVLDPDSAGPLRSVAGFARHFGGAEVNVAVALARLGHRTAWAGGLGDDEFGHALLAFLRGERVEVDGAHLDPEAPTGLYIKERRALDRLQVHYYRAGSAASRLRYDDLDADRLLRARVLHLTGITPMLSDAGAELTERLSAAAVQRGVTLSFDANVRWRLLGERDPRALLDRLLERADLLFCSDEEAEWLLGTRDAAELAALGREQTVVVHGDHGAYAVEPAGVTRAQSHRVTPVDTVGAGDAFVAGYLADLLLERAADECLRTAVRCGALVCASSGDWEGLPTRSELSLLDGGESVTR